MNFLQPRWRLPVRLRAIRIFLFGARAKALFRFDRAAIAISFLYPLGWGMIAIGDLDHASDNVFLAAYLMFFLAFIWAVGWWVKSDTLAGKDPSSWSRSSRGRLKMASAKRFYYLWKFGVVVVFALVFWTSYAEASIIRYNKEMSKLEGTLYPAREPTPQPCRNKSGKYTIYFPEPNIAFTTDRLPLPLFVNGRTKEVIAQAQLRADGSMGISMNIRSADQRIVVRIKDNEYLVNHNNYLQARRRNDAHDRSELSVTDQFGKKVLRIDYLNPNAFSITADLKTEGRELDTSKLTMVNGCLEVDHGPEGAAVLAF